MTRTLVKSKKLVCTFLTIVVAGCTNLEEKVIDEVLGSESAKPENALAAAYNRLSNATFVDHGNVFALQEYSTDEALLPTRGSDWGDGGRWRVFHEFTWSPEEGVIGGTWNNLTHGITQSLTAISTLNGQEFAEKALFLAEAKGLLAFYTFHTLDLFGQAPYRDPLTADAPFQVLQAATAIDELIQQVEAIVPDLANVGEQSTHSGRFTKQAAYGLLAEMYLNRAVFKDRYAADFNFNAQAIDGNGTDMDKVIQYTSELIGSGRFNLESNYFRNFDIDNAGRPEMIFVASQDNNTLRGSDNDFAYMPMERNQKPSPANRGTNASCITPEFYYSWEGNFDDPRFHRHYQYDDGTWFMNDGTDVSVPATSIVPNSDGLPWFHFNRGIMAGQQYGPTLLPSGVFEMTNNGRIKVNKLYCEKNTTLAMDFTPELNFDNPAQSVFTQAQINRGARVFKWEFDPENGNGTTGVDVPLYRLGGIYCMRAEAYFRKGLIAEALADVNMLRTSRTREALFDNAPGKPIDALDEETLYNEIGYEMYWEMNRRKQMIRFGKFEDAYTAKPVSEPFRRIYPIPQATMDASDAFTQNEGYN
ncbi:RagB/SusD family nutrient uptake outer membrane protein [Parapedobacter indicus]|uniref:Starch-binding associating with outer membrane n=1 Tax=Parapedobacter indicus TaxID=1477437 RepID=A0A1I3PZF3_9SPHI|nr:RagB/SusD family nutrient uptake outer membrane protein [Parapedobacter indicus]PPL00612.1 putative outer membrane starch-binding protein [Parapedobacter indicus]SFJ26591.1 Starch-binding associating with outer membrane [Parapedobacter indicus]